MAGKGSMMKLTYFDARGRAEVCRLVLAAAKKPYTDNRIQMEEWPAVKPTTPMGGLPVLEVDGKAYGQGIALAAFLARENGLYGSKNTDSLVIDMLAQVKEDLLIEEGKVMFESDEAKKNEMLKKLQEETVPRILGLFTKFIKENPAKSGFTVGKKLSLADLIIFEAVTNTLMKSPNILDKYPELKALHAKVQSADGIKQYLAKRKDTPF